MMIRPRMTLSPMRGPRYWRSVKSLTKRYCVSHAFFTHNVPVVISCVLKPQASSYQSVREGTVVVQPVIRGLLNHGG